MSRAALAPSHPAAGVARSAAVTRGAPLARRAREALRTSVRLAPQYLAWQAQRSGRPALAGLALLAASALFWYSTQQPLVAEVTRLRTELATLRAAAQPGAATAASDAALTLANLPARNAMPQLLGVLLEQASEANLAIDSAKYESSTSKSGDIERYKVAFPVSGPYPAVRRFIDATLTAVPSAAIDDLRIERKSVGDASVEAHLRLSLYTRAGP